MKATNTPTKDAMAELTKELNRIFNMRVRFDYEATDKIGCELYVSVKKITRYYKQINNSVFFNIEGTLAISLLDNKCAFYIGTLTDKVINNMIPSQLNLYDNEMLATGLSTMDFDYSTKEYKLNDPTSDIEIKNVDSEAIENF